MQQSKFGLGSKGEEKGSSMKISIVPFLRAFYARMIYSFLISIFVGHDYSLAFKL